MTRTWYRLRAARHTAELLIYDEIGAWGKTASGLLNELTDLGDLQRIDLRINSPGGDVFEALAIHNALARHPARVVIHIDALCASAATVVALAGDEIRMADNALFMIHDVWTALSGNAEQLQQAADRINTLSEQIAALYARKTGADPELIRQWMQTETWLTADQALQAGFIDAIDEPLKMAALARHDLTRFKNHPKEMLPMPLDTPAPETLTVTAPPVIPDTPDVPETADVPPPALDPVIISQLCLTASEPALIPALLKAAQTEASVRHALATAQTVRQICAMAKAPELADGLIATGASPDQAKLITWNALVARAEASPVDNTPPAAIPDHLPLEDRCAAEWQRSPDLRAEFGTLNTYQAYARAQASGRVHIKGR
jgi:ATP-dependent Clp protease, protease subunit